ncbi:MAG: YceG family protein [Sarcina sp.]
MFINLSFNNLKSNNIFQDLFTKQVDRSLVPGEYNSYFCRYLGLVDKEKYNNNIAFLNSKKEECKILELPIKLNNSSLENEIREKIEIYRENFYKYINFFLDNSLNLRSYKAIDLINEILNNNNFYENKKIEILSFIVVASNEILKNSNWSDIDNPKVIFYGNSGEKEAYLMLFLKFIGVDILYLSPERNDLNIFIKEIDNYAFKIEGIESYEGISFYERVSRGKVVTEVKTIGVEAREELEEQMFNEDTGFYRPWQFENYKMNSVLLNSTFEEISIYYNEKAIVRPGFEVKNNTVNIPNFFSLVTGITNDKESFGEFLREIFDKENVLVLNNIAIYNYPIGYDEAMDYKKCFDNFGKVTVEKINYHISGNRFKNYRESLKKLFVYKINEILNSSYMMNCTFSERDKVEYLATIMTMPEEFFQLLDSFDFTDKIPKITFYRDNDQSLSIRELYVLTFLNSMGIDIIIYSSFATYGIEKWINRNYITYHRLENIEYNFDLESAMKSYKKKGFLSKFFKK